MVRIDRMYNTRGGIHSVWVNEVYLSGGMFCKGSGKIVNREIARGFFIVYIS